MMKYSKFRDKQDWSRQVLKSIEHQIKAGLYESKEQKHKQRQVNYFAKNYDKLKTVEFKEMEELNTNKFFYMHKLKPSWSFGKSKNPLAIYPVLCGRADYSDDTKWVRISRENIGKLAGISTKCVDKGVEQLRQLTLTADEITTPMLERQEWQDEQRRGYEYLPGFFRYDTAGLDPKDWKGQFFAFHTCIVSSGIWAGLSRKAKALYIAMRSKSFFDYQAYEYIEGIRIPNHQEMYEDYAGGSWSYNSDKELNAGEAKTLFRNRKWDVCDSSLKELFNLAKIPYRSTRQIVDELEKSGLLERAHKTKSIFKVFLKPEPLLKN